ncbi:MAG: hypothetical protein EOO50_12140 [Flavobacterium sp.]|uniref:hypothetical protein n=1 Tax=Flavobacterium sp. TaxID=239 RepID=UPI00122A634C|nr:hypothetical protein [Flavobacterium sp.]RZJ65863.1 MAG: hypothetical protein EOO50_12140 [Flavobacterium sp.]
MKHRRLSFYTPGLISLVLLPLLAILFMYQRKAFVNYNSMDLSLIGDTEFDNQIRKDWETRTKSITFTHIYLTGNDAADSLECRKAHITVRNFKASKDMSSGLKFHFSDKAKYWTFIRVLDIFAIEDIPIYLVDGSEITVVNPRPRPQVKHEYVRTLGCGGFSFGNDVVEIQPSQDWASEIKNFISIYFPVVIAYLLLLFFAIRQIRKDAIRNRVFFVE